MSVTSVCMASALPPFPVNSSATAWMRSVRRAPSTTHAPCVERSRAVASPSPLLAPVMTTTFPSMLLLIGLQLLSKLSEETALLLVAARLNQSWHKVQQGNDEKAGQGQINIPKH